MLQLLFYLPSLVLLHLSQVDLEFPLYGLQLVSVTIPECPPLPVQDVLDITGDPGLVVVEAAYSSTEVQVVISAVCDPFDVLTMCFLQDAPVSTFKAVPQSLRCLTISFTVTCPWLHHLLLINSASPPPLLLPLRPQSRSTPTLVNPGRSPLGSGMFWVSQVSERQSKLHSELNVLSVLTRAANSPISLVREFTFPINIDRTEGLYFHRVAIVAMNYKFMFRQ